MKQKFNITTDEKYSIKFGQHILILRVIATNIETGKRHLLHKHKVKIPKNVPTWITENNLWHLTDLELKELNDFSKSLGKPQPDKDSVKQYNDLQNVLESNQHKN